MSTSIKFASNYGTVRSSHRILKIVALQSFPKNACNIFTPTTCFIFLRFVFFFFNSVEYHYFRGPLMMSDISPVWCGVEERGAAHLEGHMCSFSRSVTSNGARCGWNERKEKIRARHTKKKKKKIETKPAEP